MSREWNPCAVPPRIATRDHSSLLIDLRVDLGGRASTSRAAAGWAHEIGGSRMFTVVAITQRYAGHARQAGHLLNQCGAGAYMSRYSVVVDDDRSEERRVGKAGSTGRAPHH